MYAVLDRVTLADLLSDFLRSEKRMGWIQLNMTSVDTPDISPAVPPSSR
jgi:hypothetical protein